MANGHTHYPYVIDNYCYSRKEMRAIKKMVRDYRIALLYMKDAYLGHIAAYVLYCKGKARLFKV